MPRYSLDQRLAELREHRDWVESLRHEAVRDTRELIEEAVAEGWPKTRIAKTAGISRQTVYDILNGK